MLFFFIFVRRRRAVYCICFTMFKTYVLCVKTNQCCCWFQFDFHKMLFSSSSSLLYYTYEFIQEFVFVWLNYWNGWLILCYVKLSIKGCEKFTSVWNLTKAFVTIFVSNSSYDSFSFVWNSISMSRSDH